jgi:hypothetical protein
MCKILCFFRFLRGTTPSPPRLFVFQYESTDLGALALTTYHGTLGVVAEPFAHICHVTSMVKILASLSRN